jgi:hypothetical protein
MTLEDTDLVVEVCIRDEDRHPGVVSLAGVLSLCRARSMMDPSLQGHKIVYIKDLWMPSPASSHGRPGRFVPGMWPLSRSNPFM